MDATQPTVKTANKANKGYVIAVVGVIIWSTTAVLIRYLTEHQSVPPLLLAAWRDLLACLGMAAILGVVNRKLLRISRSQIKFFVFYGLVLAVFNALWTISVSLNGAAVSVVLVYSSAAFTALIAWRLFGERLSLPKWIAILASLGGCVLVGGAYQAEVWQTNTLGVIAGLLSGLSMTGYSLFGKESARREISAWTALTYSFGIAAVILFASNLILPELGGASLTDASLALKIDATGWGILVLLALGPTIGGYGLYTLSMSYLPASVVNLIATLEPSLTAVQSYLLLGERFTLEQIIGSLLVVGGVVLLRIYER